ncbi:c-type cytochrome biogenesis protein CcsB [Flavicella sediminum]|uniref:c-type cytochrome biogenesis protein CcsB n=1 Tax=Flavicella sediminum TaxID=2585141 RepID=UPI001122A870|nr:c-type cytochrome biogenesis protein CcsB [Flavicella sediminum]
MKKIVALLFSTKLMAVLFLVFATAMGIATFIENDFGTQTSKALVYNTWWFEAIMVLFTINFFGNIFRYRLYKKEKWAVLLFHLSFLCILIGAGITRYISYEGIMPIKEGETSNVFFSDRTYVTVTLDDNKEQKIVEDDLLLSAWGTNNYSLNTDFRGQEVSLELTNYIPNAFTEFKESENGEKYIHFVESSSGSRHDHYIKKGEIENIHGVLVGYAHKENALVNFEEVGDELRMESLFDGTFLRMADQLKGSIKKDTLETFKYLTLHSIAGLSFVVPKPPLKGEMAVVSGNKDEHPEDLLVFNVSTKNENTSIEVKGGQYATNAPVQFTLGDLNFRVTYGAKEINLPFQIKLNDFQLENYPGSQSAMSYASEITVIDIDKTFDFRVFMNNILNYKGYKFFQSSYDITDQYEETRLSVNHDYWGTLVTYIGYFALYAGLLLILFVKNTRFSGLRHQLRKIKKKQATLCMLLFMIAFSGFSQEDGHDHEHDHNHEQEHEEQASTHKNHVNKITDAQLDSIMAANAVDAQHAEDFSELVIQDAGGRMKPVHTFASQLLRKVSKKETYKGLNSNQVFLSIVQNPTLWFQVPVIYLERGNDKLRSLLGIPVTDKYARLIDFIDQNGHYKIKELVIEAQKNSIKSKFQKDVINVDKRVGLLYSAIGGGILRIFPIPKDATNKWVSQPELSTAKFTGIDSVFVKQILPVYIQTLGQAKISNDYTETDKILDGIKNFQKKYGAAVYPSDDKIKFEIAYNKYDIFKKLFMYYMYAGLLLFILVIVQIFTKSKLLNISIKFIVGLVLLFFAMHTAGLAARWFISGHAPWSNAYESMIYVAWATMFFGLVFGRKSTLTIAATAFLTSMILMIAHWNWMDPEIANLVPVLNSYWLMIHVAIIVASYGPFALGMILGFIALILTILTNESNKKKLNETIKELTIINEMSVTVGLIMLTIGNFLGGMWANESWGRYWGWDPKETWALISIMIYAFILHMRLVPGLRGRFTYNLWSVIAFASIIMTYFGVNFYLSGLHSYASGDKIVTPTFVYYSIGIVAVLGVLAYRKHLKYYKK